MRPIFMAGLVVSLFGCRKGVPPATASSQVPPSDRELFLDHVQAEFEASYAPLGHKTATLGWDLDTQMNQLRDKARDPQLDDPSFRRAMYQFFRSPEDIHTAINFDSGRVVWLGVHVMQTPSGYRVGWVDRSIHPTEPQVGDEVVALDGVPIEDAVRHAGEQTAWRSTPGFAQAFAEWFTTFRGTSGWDQLPEPGDEAVLEIRRAGETQQLRLPWRDADTETGIPARERCPFWAPSRVGYLPDLGPVVWRNEEAEHIDAYVFESEGLRYGYARIWTHGWGADTAAAIREFDVAVDAFLEQDVQGVVLDQLGNGGGNFTLGLTMLSRVSQAPRIAPTQRFRYAESGVVGFYDAPFFRGLGEQLAGVTDDEGAAGAFAEIPLLSGPLAYLPATVETTKELSDFLSFITEPPRREGPLSPPKFQIVERYRPDPARGPVYTGPVVLLVDGRNISAAEYTAAALYDNPGATLFGVTTAGAGGDQRTYSRENICAETPGDPLSPCVPSEMAGVMERLGVRSFSLTITLGYRVLADGTVTSTLENEGVSPHAPYLIGEEDLRTDFGPMRAEIVRTLLR